MLSGFKGIKKMNLHSTIWSLITILLSFSINRCPLPRADCLHLNNLGNLTVEPAPLFLIGSNLTVYCHISKCQQRVKLFLEHERKIVDPSKIFNCTMAIFHLFNVRMPRSKLLCKLQIYDPEIVDGLNLQGGLPPDKPENIICETSRNSHFIGCSWDRGQETYVQTTYNISVSRENGTQILFYQIQDAANITIPRTKMDANTKYQLIITAHNHFGTSLSDPIILCVKVIPETPHIMQIKFGNNSMAATLQWKTTESSEHLRSYVRLRTDEGSWEAVEGTQLSEDLIQVDGLKPLTEYEFQMRTCNTTSGLLQTNTPSFTLTSTTNKRASCSKWSASVRRRSPGKGPSQQLHVWRMLSNQGKNGSQKVIVLWEPPSPEDYSGEVKQYKVFFDDDQNREVTCPAAFNWCSVQVPVDIQTLTIRAFTSYGASPPADVPLRHSGDSGPVLKKLVPFANGSAVLVSWLGDKRWSTPGGELLHFVLEWTSVPVTNLQWQKLTKDQNSTVITGLTAGVRYNISLYAVTSRGVSAPSFSLVYSKEEKPVSGPALSVLAHEAKHIWIQWDEVPVNQLRGFITNYTIYIQALDSSNTELIETVSASKPRQKWLDCPEGALALQLTASTSAGEGRRGRRIFSQPSTPAVDLVIGMVFILVLFITIIANLLCWSCVRERIKQKCISWGPAWLELKLPKPGNSFAIKLLEQDGSELPLSSTYSDPPLSPISLISQEERDNLYPNVHVEPRRAGSGQSAAGTPFLTSGSGTVLIDSQLDHVSYKPQVAMFAQEEEEMMEMEEERDTPTSEEEDRCSSVCGGLLGGFLSTVDFSDSPLGLTFNSVSGSLYHKTPETISFLNGGFLLGRSEKDVEADPPSTVLNQGEILTHDAADTCFSQYTVETTLAEGYFPQVAAVNSVALCETER